MGGIFLVGDSSFCFNIFRSRRKQQAGQGRVLYMYVVDFFLAAAEGTYIAAARLCQVFKGFLFILLRVVSFSHSRLGRFLCSFVYMTALLKSILHAARGVFLPEAGPASLPQSSPHM